MATINMNKLKRLKNNLFESNEQIENMKRLKNFASRLANLG